MINKIPALLILLFFASVSSAQGQINVQNFNKKKLEHLVKIKVDSVRRSHNCKDLINDSILYVASNHHAIYMLEQNRLSHDETDPITKTPQLRAKYYGAKNYSVGENVLKTFYNTTITTKNKKKINTNTYEGLATAIVTGWVNSPGHFKNIITPGYQITGVTVAINIEKNILYACQKFASVKYQYSFTESKIMFPYSSYQPEPLVNSFAGIPNELIHHDHQWKLKHDKLAKCDQCETIVKNQPRIKLTKRKRSYILEIEDVDYVKQLIKSKKDGFAVELVAFDDYMCGNPAYYTKPSRRNGQCRLNGKILQPIYRNDLLKGYKKRKRNKEVKFFSYLFGADSIKFVNRFHRYKVEKYNSQYFKINLGKLPKDFTGYLNHNLVYIQDNQICHIDYFTNYCGEFFQDYRQPAFIPPDTLIDYSFQLDTQIVAFKIPFEKNKYDFTIADIEPFLDYLEQDYTIDSLSIKAFSSIEGNPTINENLQIQRANSIVQVLKEQQKETIKTKIEVDPNWEHFYTTIKKNRKWKFLAAYPKEELQQIVNEKYSDSLEFILAKERYAEIILHNTITLSDANLAYYINKEQQTLTAALRKLNSKSEAFKTLLIQYQKFYKFVYKKVIENKVDTSLLANLKLPKYFNTNLRLTESYILYGDQFFEAFKDNAHWIKNRDILSEALIKDYLPLLSRAFVYNDCRLKSEKVIHQEELNSEAINEIMIEMKFLTNYSSIPKKEQPDIDRIYFNLTSYLLSKGLVVAPTEESQNTVTAFGEIISFYNKYEELTDSLALKLAKMAVGYNEVGLARRILAPHQDNDTIIAYLTPMSYQHNAFDTNNNFYLKLIELSKTMDTDLWCNLFLQKCQIPFQAFDNELLRAIFCEQCMDSNRFIKQILD